MNSENLDLSQIVIGATMKMLITLRPVANKEQVKRHRPLFITALHIE